MLLRLHQRLITELERLVALFKAKGWPAAEKEEEEEGEEDGDDDEEEDDDSEEEGFVKGPGVALALLKSAHTSGVNATNATDVRTSLPAALPSYPPKMPSNATLVTPASSSIAAKTSTEAAPSSATQSELQQLIASLNGNNENVDNYIGRLVRVGER
ncbi:hypothetical protein CF336_g8247 [Tilletia laevis]|nr:hypothetical protein CF336_g8247 [Tilletia laevis]KAE8185435.1 hypothetical protein CF335_g7723 [Tilletia laevis]KAE8197000.1 hypothetical protein CF328_g3974 [Tilletia controversa]